MSKQFTYFTSPVRLVLLLLLVTAGRMHAQHPSAMATITVSATVMDVNTVELVTVRNMTISPEDVNDRWVLYISPLTSSNSAMLKASGQPGTTARLVFCRSETLYGNGDPLTVQYEMAGHTERIQAAATLCESNPFHFTFGTKGTYYLWMGAQIDLGKNPGTRYNGQITIEIEYL
jgi:hypothetical protein